MVFINFKFFIMHSSIISRLTQLKKDCEEIKMLVFVKLIDVLRLTSELYRRMLQLKSDAISSSSSIESYSNNSYPHFVEEAQDMFQRRMEWVQTKVRGSNFCHVYPHSILVKAWSPRSCMREVK
jgi:hypothetical protein